MIPAQIAAAVQHHWWLFLLRGVAALAFGVLTLAWPGATLLVLMAFIAAYALVDGIVALVYAFRLRPMFDRWWMLLVQGLISGAFGVLAFIYPSLSLAYIVVSVSLWMLMASIVQFLLARAQRAMGAAPGWSVRGGSRPPEGSPAPSPGRAKPPPTPAARRSTACEYRREQRVTAVRDRRRGVALPPPAAPGGRSPPEPESHSARASTVRRAWLPAAGFAAPWRR